MNLTAKTLGTNIRKVTDDNMIVYIFNKITDFCYNDVMLATNGYK